MSLGQLTYNQIIELIKRPSELVDLSPERAELIYLALSLLHHVLGLDETQRIELLQQVKTAQLTLSTVENHKDIVKSSEDSQKDQFRNSIDILIQDRVPYIQQLKSKINAYQSLFDFRKYISDRIPDKSNRNKLFNGIVSSAKQIGDQINKLIANIRDQNEYTKTKYPVKEKILNRLVNHDNETIRLNFLSVISGFPVEKIKLLLDLKNVNSEFAKRVNYFVNADNDTPYSILTIEHYIDLELIATDLQILRNSLSGLYSGDGNIIDVIVDKLSSSANPTHDYTYLIYGFNIDSSEFKELYEKAKSAYKIIHRPDSTMTQNDRVYSLELFSDTSRYQEEVNWMKKNIQSTAERIIEELKPFQADDLVKYQVLESGLHGYLLASQEQSKTKYLDLLISQIIKSKQSLSEFTNSNGPIKKLLNKNEELRSQFNLIQSKLTVIENCSTKIIKSESNCDTLINEINELINIVINIVNNIKTNIIFGFRNQDRDRFIAALSALSGTLDSLQSNEIDLLNLRDDSKLLAFKPASFENKELTGDGVFISFQEMIEHTLSGQIEFNPQN